MKKTIEEIIQGLRVSILPKNYPNEFAVLALIERAYKEGHGDGYNEGYKDAEDVSKYDQQEYLK